MASPEQKAPIGDQRHGQKGPGSRSGAGHLQTTDEEPKTRERPRKAKPKTRGQRQLQQPAGKSRTQESPQAGEPHSSTVTSSGGPTGHMAPRPLLCGLPTHRPPDHGGATTPSDWSQMAGEAIGSSRIARPAAPSCPAELPPQCPSDTCGGATAEPAQAQRGAGTDARHGGRQLKLHELRRVQPQASSGESSNPHPPATNGRSPPSSARPGASTEIDRQVSRNPETLGEHAGGHPPLHARGVSTGSCSPKGLRPL